MVMIGVSSCVTQCLGYTLHRHISQSASAYYCLHFFFQTSIVLSFPVTLRTHLCAEMNLLDGCFHYTFHVHID